MRDKDEDFIEKAEKEMMQQRRKELGQLTLGQYIPMVSRSVDESAHCYVFKSFVASVVMSALAVEIALRHLIREKRLELKQDVDKMDFVQLIDWAHHLNLLNQKQFENADRLRKRRNDLLHFKSFERIVKREVTMRRLRLDERRMRSIRRLSLRFSLLLEYKTWLWRAIS